LSHTLRPAPRLCQPPAGPRAGAQFFFDPPFSRRDAYAFGIQTVIIF
jgi:hypothetical protein